MKESFLSNKDKTTIAEIDKIYAELDGDIKEAYKVTDLKKTSLIDDIYLEAPKYLKEREEKKKESHFKKLLRFLIGG